jgi:hypothetical protein
MTEQLAFRLPILVQSTTKLGFPEPLYAERLLTIANHAELHGLFCDIDAFSKPE